MGSVQPLSLAEKRVQEWRSTCFEKAKAHQAPRPPGACPHTLTDATGHHLKGEAYLICLWCSYVDDPTSSQVLTASAHRNTCDVT